MGDGGWGTDLRMGRRMIDSSIMTASTVNSVEKKYWPWSIKMTLMLQYQFDYHSTYVIETLVL